MWLGFRRVLFRSRVIFEGIVADLVVHGGGSIKQKRHPKVPRRITSIGARSHRALCHPEPAERGEGSVACLTRYGSFGVFAPQDDRLDGAAFLLLRFVARRFFRARAL